MVSAHCLLGLLTEEMGNHAEVDKTEKSEPGLEVLWPLLDPLLMQ